MESLLPYGLRQIRVYDTLKYAYLAYLPALVMEVSQETVDKVQQFAEDRQRAEEFYAEQQITASDIQAYEKKLDDTLRELQDRVKRQEHDLWKLRAANSTDISNSATGSPSRIAQVRRAKVAYDSLLKSETDLPKPNSALPSLLAIEEISRIVKESKVSVVKTAESISGARQRLKKEEMNLRDAQLIRDGLQSRIDNIKTERSTTRGKSPAQRARELMKEQQVKKDFLDRDTEYIRASLHKFCENTLASMIAAEDLGGPVVGDIAEISDATLASGYTRQGKPKKPKNLETDADGGNQHRVDDMLRRQTGQPRNLQANGRETAAVEMHEMIDSLIDAGLSYIDLPRESAASRFLVKAKVAQFHPRDARRLRLIDFGRSLHD